MRQLAIGILLLFASFINVCQAQTVEEVPLNVLPTVEGKHRDWKFAFALDIRNSFVLSRVKDSFIKRSGVTIWGFYAGFEFKEKHLYSAGIYSLTKRSESRINEANKKLSFVLTKWDLTFLSLGYTYTFFDKKKWELKIPVEIGAGYGSIKNDIIGSTAQTKKGFISPVQLGFIVDFQLTRWVGLYGAVGYRKLLIQGPFNNDFDSMYYSVGGIIYFTTIVEDLQKRAVRRREKRRNK